MFGEQQLEFFNKKNYLGGLTLDGRINQMGNTIEKYEKDYYMGLSKRIKQYIKDQWLSPSTPQWANFGISVEGQSPLPASCFIVAPENSIKGIYYSLGEIAMMSKLGGGVGIDYTNLYDEGTYLEKDEFYTNSKLDWIEDGVATAQKVSQGSRRRGYSVPFISIDDKEFDLVMDRSSKKNPDKDDPLVSNNIGVILPIDFDERVKTDKVLKKNYLRALQERLSSGKVYLIHTRNCNKNQSPVYEILGHVVQSSNICVSGDQMVATEEGFKTVESLYKEETPLLLFDGFKKVNSSKMKLRRESAKVYKITLKNGLTHKVTKDHKIKKYDPTKTHGKRYEMASIEDGLEVGDHLCYQTKKGIFGKTHRPEEAFILGLFQGDGSSVGKGNVRVSLWENDFDLKEEVLNIFEKTWLKHEEKALSLNSKRPKFSKKQTSDSNIKAVNIHTPAFKYEGLDFPKYCVPDWIWSSDEETQWQYFRGLWYADATVGSYNTGKSYGEPISLIHATIQKEHLRELQILLLNLGINAKIHFDRKAGKNLLPKNDGSGEYKLYDTKSMDRIIVSNKNDLQTIEENTKFLSRKNVFFEKRIYRDNTKKSSKISSIELIGEEPVYCPTVDSEENLWVCNGMITSNCVEITTPKYDDKSFVCVICSVNANYWNKFKDNPQFFKDCYAFLDINVSEFIRLTEGVPFMEKARRSAIEKRDIGLGTLGLHSYFQSKKAAFGGLHSRALNKEIYSTIQKYGLEYAKEIGEKLGSPKLCKEAGLVRRNVSLNMVAPNKTTAFLCGDTSAGREPFKSNYYVKELAGIQTTFKNPHLEKLLNEKSQNTNEVWDSILQNLGSVQHLDFLTEEEKSWLKTFSEISPKDVIDLAADAQEFIDMAQSVNLESRPNYTIQDIYNIHKYAWERGIKTLYYFYPQIHAALEKSGESWDTCESCAD